MNNFLIKIYGNSNSDLIEQQIFNIYDFSIKEDLMSFDTAKITLPNTTTWLRKFQKVEIIEITHDIQNTTWTEAVYENLEDLTKNLEYYTMNLEDVGLISSSTTTITRQVNSQDNVIFQWFIQDMNVNSTSIWLTLRSQKALFERKGILSDKTYSNKTISFILDDLFSDWNTFTWETYTYETDISQIITKDFKEWDSFFNILDELSELTWAVWNILENKVYFKTELWEDRTTWDNFLSLKYNRQIPKANNILEPIMQSNWVLANIIIWKSWATKQTVKDTNSIATYWALAEFISFREWDLTNQVNQALDLKKQEQRLYKIDLETNKVNANIWEKLVLSIENTDEYRNFTWDVTVQTKELTLVNWTKFVKLWVSDVIVITDSFSNKIRQINKEVKLLNL